MHLSRTHGGKEKGAAGRHGSENETVRQRQTHIATGRRRDGSTGRRRDGESEKQEGRDNRAQQRSVTAQMYRSVFVLMLFVFELVVCEAALLCVLPMCFAYLVVALPAMHVGLCDVRLALLVSLLHGICRAQKKVHFLFLFLFYKIFF